MLQFHNSSYLFSLLPLWVQAGPALPGQSVPGLTDMKGSIASSRGGPLAALQTLEYFPHLEGTIRAALTEETEVEVFISKHSWCPASAICKSPPAGRKGLGEGRKRERW